MKKIFLMITVLACFKVYAQDDIQQVQQEWGKDKKELVRMAMELSAADSAKFWPVYDQYEVQRQKLGRDRILIIDDYAKNYAGMTNAKADELINRVFKNDAAMGQLQQQYYNKVKTALNAMEAAKALQIESYISSVIKASLQTELPIIGEIDNLKSKK